MSMNRNIIHTLWMALPLLLASCQQEELPDMNSASDAALLSITVTDGGYASTDKSATRAAENGYRTIFTEGDTCGLYIVRGGTVVYDNVKLTVTAGIDGSLRWKSDVTLAGGLDNEKYFLYYPYQSVMRGKTDASATDADGFFAPLVSGWQPAVDQSDYAAYTGSDLMTATGTASKNGNQLNLIFGMTHRMAMAVIEMPKTLYKFTDNADGAIPDCTMATVADFTDSETKPCRMEDGTYRCIVNPMQPVYLIGRYDKGKKEFAFTSNCIAGSYKTYRVDGATITEKQASLQMGDYFCKDSDNKWYIIPQEANPDGNVIGIVFHVGQNLYDTCDYSESAIGQQKCHGYVVALTDANNGESDRLRWEYGPNGEYNVSLYHNVSLSGTSISRSDWKGYSQSLKFHELINKDEYKGAGWEMKHFPAALACETYGNRTLDHEGNPTADYDWQHPLAAPNSTSGWFLPSCSQLRNLYRNSSVLSDRMAYIKNSIPDDCSYKDKIKWFTSSYYWSSSEDASPMFKGVWTVEFVNGSASNIINRSTPYDVRAILAF